MTTPDIHSSIGIADVYRVLTELQSTMTKVVTHMERIDTRNEFADRLHADIEARLRVIEACNPTETVRTLAKAEDRIAQLERFRYTLAGVIALCSIVFSGLGAFLISTLIHH